MRWWLLWLWMCVLVACSTALPSSVPLGTGSLAEPEPTDELESGTQDKTAKPQAKTDKAEASDEAEDEGEEGGERLSGELTYHFEGWRRLD